MIFINLCLGISHFYLYSEKGVTFDFPTIFTANVAILSTIIVICAFVITAAGLAKLESIEKEAIQKAEESAKKAATKRTRKILKSEKFIQEVAEATKKNYDKEKANLYLKEDNTEEIERDEG